MKREIIDSEMAKIQYGWIDKDGGRHEKLSGFSKNYLLQTAEELRKSRLGVCLDQVELERALFAEQGITARSFFIVYYNGEMDPAHTFVIVKDDEKYIWYEHAWEKYRGWHEFDSLKDALRDIREKFISIELSEGFDPMQLCIFEYEKPQKKLNCQEFYAHCANGKSVGATLG